MAFRQKKQNMDTGDTQQPAAKRQKKYPARPATLSRHTSVPRDNSVVKGARTAQATTTTATRTSNAEKPDVRMRPVHVRQARRPTSSKVHATSKEPGLLCLPLEIKEQIFLLTTARDTARLRRVCKSLNADIKGSTKYLSKQFSRKELSRLQKSVDEFTSLKPPTDFDSLMQALHVWTKRRGTFKNWEVQQDSISKLMMHLFYGLGKDSTVVDEIKILRWSWMAEYIVELCRKSDSRQLKESEIDRAYYFCSGSGLLGYNDWDKLIEHIRHPELRQQNHLLGGHQWGFRMREQLSFATRGRTTPLLQYPILSQYNMRQAGNGFNREMDAVRDYLRGEPSRSFLQATHGNLWLIRYLRLPALPNEVSCYYLSDKWAREEVTKLLALLDTVATKTNPVRVSPLRRAAILERVMRF